MKRSSYKAFSKASISLASMLRRRKKKQVANPMIRAAGFAGQVDEVVENKSKVALTLRCDAKKFKDEVQVGADDEIEHLEDGIYSANVTLDCASDLMKLDSVGQVQTKKRSSLHLGKATQAIGLRATPAGTRVVAETGKGVLIGIVDSGFDLSHPMFRDSGGKLRVDGILDQNTNQEFTSQSDIEAAWAGQTNPTGPGGDGNGHGTHVATIAGGTKFRSLEGVAPEARFLLVKTNFVDTDKAVQWIFNQAGSTPCVTNLSLGHHWGAHDGTTLEDQLHETLVGRGKIIVVSAGNERTDNIHIGGRFVPNETQTVGFRVLRQIPPDPPFAVITLWYDQLDDFDITVVTPSGQNLNVPAMGRIASFSNSQLDIELGRSVHHGATPSVKVQMAFAFSNATVSSRLLNGWGLRMSCNNATIGRIDGWFNNSGFGEFQTHPLVELTRTIGLSATGRGCIAVASHVSSNQWNSDDGSQTDGNVLAERISPFSSQGPTRDGRQKPEISAPGQYLTAALARGSGSAAWDERAIQSQRLLSIEGTSMAAPMATGAIALMLQKKATLTPLAVQRALAEAAIVDGHTSSVWNPSYGHGKLDVAKALQEI